MGNEEPNQKMARTPVRTVNAMVVGMQHWLVAGVCVWHFCHPLLKSEETKQQLD